MTHRVTNRLTIRYNTRQPAFKRALERHLFADQKRGLILQFEEKNTEWANQLDRLGGSRRMTATVKGAVTGSYYSKRRVRQPNPEAY